MAYPPINCQICGTNFTPAAHNSTCCSPTCRRERERRREGNARLMNRKPRVYSTPRVPLGNGRDPIFAVLDAMIAAEDR